MRFDFTGLGRGSPSTQPPGLLRAAPSSKKLKQAIGAYQAAGNNGDDASVESRGKLGVLALQLSEASPAEAPSHQWLLGDDRGRARRANVKRYLADDCARPGSGDPKGATPERSYLDRRPTGLDEIHIVRGRPLLNEGFSLVHLDPLEPSDRAVWPELDRESPVQQAPRCCGCRPTGPSGRVRRAVAFRTSSVPHQASVQCEAHPRSRCPACRE